MTPRIHREQKTVQAMIRMYCCRKHNTADICGECTALLQYAEKQTANCRFGIKKPVCSRCKSHCYREPERINIKRVMRYAGPRMLFRHPWLSLLHIKDRIISK